MWVTSPPLEMPQARAALTAVVPDLEWRVAAGQIELLDYREWYTPSGKFRVEEVLQGWDARLTAARERGFVACVSPATPSGSKKPTGRISPTMKR